MGPDSSGKICVLNVGNNDTICFENEVPVATPDGSQTFVCVPDGCMGHNPRACSAPICTTKDDCFAYGPSTDCIDLSESTNGAVGKRCAAVLGASEFCDPTYLTYSTPLGLVCVTGGCADECQFTPAATTSTCVSSTACDAEGLCIPPMNQDSASLGDVCTDYVANGTPCAKSGTVLQGRCVLSGGQLPLVCQKSCAMSGNDCGVNEICFNEFSSSFGICAPTPVCPNGVQDVGEQCDDNNSTAGDGCSSSCKYEVDEVEPNDDYSIANITSSTSIRAVITPGTDVDFFRFTAPSAGTFTAEITGVYDATCLFNTPGKKYIDTFLLLTSSSGSELASNDDIDPNTNRCSKITATLPAAGEYYVGVFGFDGTTEFPYDLVLTLP
jgi:cysteine-rich repeat protein